MSHRYSFSISKGLLLSIVLISILMSSAFTIQAQELLSGSGTIDTDSPIASPGNCGTTERYVTLGTITLNAPATLNISFTASEELYLLIATANDITTFFYVNNGPGLTDVSPGTYHLFIVDCEAIAAGSFSSATYSFTVSTVGDDVEEVSNVVLPESPQPAFTDKRINNYDGAAPIAVFPITVAEGTDWHVYSADGRLLLIVTAEQIASAPANPSENTLIASGNDVSVYRISGESQGKWQIMAPQYNGKTYVLIFDLAQAGESYRSYETD